MPSVLKEPVAMLAPTFVASGSDEQAAPRIPRHMGLDLDVLFFLPDSTRCVSTPRSRNTLSNLTPYITPVAPVMPTTILFMTFILPGATYTTKTRSILCNLYACRLISFRPFDGMTFAERGRKHRVAWYRQRRLRKYKRQPLPPSCKESARGPPVRAGDVSHRANQSLSNGNHYFWLVSRTLYL